MLAIKEASETKNVSDKLGKNTDFAENQEVSNFLVKKLTELNFQGLTVRFTFYCFIFYFVRKAGERWLNLTCLKVFLSWFLVSNSAISSSHSRELFGILLSYTLVAKQLSCQVAFLRDVNDGIITHFSDV